MKTEGIQFSLFLCLGRYMPTTTEQDERARARAYYAKNKEKIKQRRRAKRAAAAKAQTGGVAGSCGSPAKNPYPFEQLPEDLVRHICSFLTGVEPQFAAEFRHSPLVERACHYEQAVKNLRENIEEQKVSRKFLTDLADINRTREIWEVEMGVVYQHGEGGLQRLYRVCCTVLNVTSLPSRHPCS